VRRGEARLARDRKILKDKELRRDLLEVPGDGRRVGPWMHGFQRIILEDHPNLAIESFGQILTQNGRFRLAVATPVSPEEEEHG